MMYYVLGISHKSTDLSHLSRFYFDEEKQEKFRHLVRTQFEEMVMVQTCNRFECYLAGKDAQPGFLRQAVIRFLDISDVEFDSIFYFKSGRECVRHLLEVVSSLDSVILGESQILSQVREAWLNSQARGQVQKYLNRLFSTAIRVGKRVRTETSISRGAVSVSQASVQLARNFFADLGEIEAAVLGAGEMGTLALRHLLAAGVRRPWLLNRTPERAVEMSCTLSCRPGGLEQLEDVLREVDLLFSAVGVREPLLSVEMIEKIMPARRYRTLFLIDISLPFSIDPKINDLAGAFVYDIEDLKQVVDQNLAERQSQRSDVLNIISEEISDLESWHSQQSLIPGIQAIHKIRSGQGDFLLKRLSQEGTSFTPGRALELMGARLSHVMMRILKESDLDETARARVLKILQEEAADPNQPEA